MTALNKEVMLMNVYSDPNTPDIFNKKSITTLLVKREFVIFSCAFKNGH